MKTPKIEVYINDKFYMVYHNEFVALNNVAYLRHKHGTNAITVKRTTK